MARDRPERPLTDEELAEFREAMDEQGQALREALAEDLGGDPENYRVGEEPVPDGGEAE